MSSETTATYMALSEKEYYSPAGNMRGKLHVLVKFVSQGICLVILAFVYS